jgi:hypothetical protein
MLSLLKRKSDAAPAIAPAWHPNFRNFERLPDTKVVRTAFFINGGAVIVALAIVAWFVYQTYQLHDLSRQIADVQQDINRNQRTSERTIAMYKQFQADAARVAEVDAFLKSKPRISELLLRLAETLPANIAIDGLEFRASALVLRASIRGAPDQASGYAQAYVQQLKTDAVLGPKFDDIALQSLNRNPQTGRLTLEMTLKLKPVPAEGKK